MSIGVGTASYLPSFDSDFDLLLLCSSPAMLLTNTLLAATSIIIITYAIVSIEKYLSRRKICVTHGCLPPPSLPQRDPIFGLDLLLQFFKALKENRRNMSMNELFQLHGQTFQSATWGTTKIYTITPENLQAVFATDFSSWGVQPMRLFAFEPFVGRGIMCVDGALWEQSRALIKPTFARAQIADLHLTAYAAHVNKLIDLLPKDGSTVDLQPLFSRLALDSSTEFLFGESVGSLSPHSISTDARSFLEAYDYGQMVVGKRLHLPKWNFLTRDKKFWDSCNIAHEFVDEYIAQGRRICRQSENGKVAPERYILAHEMIKATRDHSDIRYQLLNVFLPAHEATGVALTNVFFNLARNPSCYAKLRQEILDAGDQAAWTFERLKSLKYLQYVINETFRLNPAIGTNTRIALRDTILPTGGGLTGTRPIYVTKGDIVTMNFYALHRRKDIFGDDANLFRPDRWKTLRPVPWSYVTFGGGPRVCPGQQLALTEVAYAIVKIVQSFPVIENRDPVEEFVEVYKITTTSRNGAKVGFPTP